MLKMYEGSPLKSYQGKPMWRPRSNLTPAHMGFLKLILTGLKSHATLSRLKRAVGSVMGLQRELG